MSVGMLKLFAPRLLSIASLRVRISRSHDDVQIRKCTQDDCDKNNSCRSGRREPFNTGPGKRDAPTLSVPSMPRVRGSR
jgi:hypothetical protein